MDKQDASARLVTALGALGVGLSTRDAASLLCLRDELLRWNAKVNLTAITAPEEVLEKHLIDSLAVLPDVTGESLLDVGAGAGFPGLPLAVARPELRVTLVDAVAKKVGFIKHAAARLGLTGRVSARQARLEGAPEREGLGAFDTVISRALMDVGPWLQLARHYVRPGGKVLSLVARAGANSEYVSLAEAAGLRFVGARSYFLPWSGDPRAVLRFERPA